MRSSSIVLLLLPLLGCAEAELARDRVTRAFGADEAVKEPVTPPVEPRYCYRTLGKVNCYTQPLPGEEANRLIGFQGPAPRSTAGTGALTP